MFWRAMASLEQLAMESVRWAFAYSSWGPCREDWLLAMRLVQPEEKERIGQFVFARDAKAAMAGRLLMRKLIVEKLNIPWNVIVLERTSKGKPVLANDLRGIHSPFNFNISHQGNFAVLAAEPNRQVGIDVMKTSLPGSGSIPDFFRIMKRQFTEEEWRAITSMRNEWLQLEMFHRHWLEVGRTYNETIMLLDGEEEKDWTFEETRLDDCHHVAVALGKPEGFKEQHAEVPRKDVTQTAFTVLAFDDLVASAVPLTPEDPACWDNFCSRQDSPARQSSNSR
ncbi:L-aminoadipate-semialdehyde dehydrogenase-phosphopantetheinyl transferase isoform X2 [Eublepharis macularius]|uniref:L-aminoadipate-semialdehyde dehydrogenase-phosphopantetheinyl transferase n=1 Tax=Eublepharis macularius TaxID=481883 RepID=A0AA97J0M5_EUBMA|nr:L-aminoadipate-semialdehyde dehydrogenase-phosphopantetheinyl transferase isoform X2 [Eublepharis macularius]